VDEQTGRVWDYRSLGATLFSGIYAPKDAPEWAHDLQRLVTEIERAEKRADAQLGFNIDIALPHELSLEQNQRLAQDFVREEWQRKGYAVIVDIHAPDPKGDDRNIHMHVWGTLRKLGKDGFAATKAEQQDNYRNRTEYTEHLREKWEKLANRHLERAGFDVRIDRRSLREQGIGREPEQHRGPQLTVIDRDGRESRINEDIRRRREQLAELRRLQAEERQLQAEKAEIINLATKRAERGTRHRHRQTESEDMDDDDIASKQREQRQAEEDRQAAIYNDMVADRNRADRFIQEWQRDHDNGERDRRHLQEAQWRREAEQDITDVRARALLAAGESRDFVQAVRREGSMITQEHAELQRDIALEKDPDKKQLLELKRDIQHADYMALANERIAAMSNLKEAVRQQEIWSNTGTDLRKERLELQERMADREAATINQEVAERMNAADRQRAEFRADIRGSQPAAPGFDPTAYPDEPALRTVARMFEADNKTQPETPREATEAHKAGAAPAAPGEAAARPGEAERPAEIIYLSPSVPERREQEPAQEDTSARRRQTQESEPVRENTDTRQNDSAQNDSAANAGITDDAKAAKKAALAQYRADIEQSIEQGQERGYGNSR
jgi:MobA/MobL family protein